MSDSQTNPAAGSPGGDAEWELLLRLDDAPPGRLHTRIRTALRDAIRSGRLGVGTTLPPSRRLAVELGCSRWAVTEAYAQLGAEGYLTAVPGSGTRVTWRATPEPPAPPRPTASTAVRYDLAPGLPDLREFPRRRWADALRVEAAGAAHETLGYPDPTGHPRLRGVLAEYVVRTRAAVARADDVLVSTSVTAGVRRLCAALLHRGITTVACEDPGWTQLRRVITSAGLRVVPVPTDQHGLRVDLLRRHQQVRAALVTPAHQFPAGTVLSPDRRADLLRWAEAVGGVVIEDDYDAEFRYDRPPVSALQGMDPSRVVLLKSLSKTLSPALGIGWMVVPAGWRDVLTGAGTAPAQPPTLDQLAFARLVETGGYDRHLRACRGRYRRRRDLLAQSLTRHLPGSTVTGLAAGLHLVLWLPEAAEPGGAVERALARGVRVADLTDYRAVDDGSAPPGLVLGYGNITDRAIEPAVRLLTEAVRATR